jgi:hypothetical protein
MNEKLAAAEALEWVLGDGVVGPSMFTIKLRAAALRAEAAHGEDVREPVAPDERVRELTEALTELLRHFARTPSSLADSEARGKAHAALAKGE